MRRHMLAFCCLGIFLLSGIWGCGKEAHEEVQDTVTGTGEVDVPHVEAEELPENHQTEEQKEAELGLETRPGTVLGEEEVVLMLEGEPQSITYVRVQGSGEYSVAYDPEQFTVTASEEEIRFDALMSSEAELPSVFLSIRKEEGASTEEVAERYIEESNEECTAEEVTLGEGEYPALWVSYAEGTAFDSRTCDLYVLRQNDVLYVVQMDCFVEAQEGLGETQQMILSTLRFHEG